MSNPLPKPCDKCKKRFQPTTRHTKLCTVCWKKAQEKRTEKIRKGGTVN